MFNKINRCKVFNIVMALFLICSIFVSVVGAAGDDNSESSKMISLEDAKDRNAQVNIENEDTNEASDSSDDDYSGKTFFNNHVNLEKSDKEVSSGPFGKFTNTISYYGTYAYACLIILYVLQCLKWFYADGGEGKGKAYIGVIALIGFLMLQYGGTIMALDVLSGQ